MSSESSKTRGSTDRWNKSLIVLWTAIAALTIQGCANTIKYGEASRAQAIETEVGINELQFATQKLISKMLKFPSVSEATQRKRPAIAVDAITNHTHQSIDVAPMTASVFEELNKSGKFTFSKNESVQASRERAKDLLDYGATTPQAAQFIGAEVEADYVVYGSLANIIRTKPTNKEVYYRISLQLLDTQSGKVVWRDEQEILKSQRKAIYGI
ncbi:MAG: penicillin-binding protein activator LpoB [Pseudomonadales bacterium]|nr:penicillin-binding protein activator LpoB [Pseudomonadales bacterium]